MPTHQPVVVRADVYPQRVGWLLWVAVLEQGKNYPIKLLFHCQRSSNFEPKLFTFSAEKNAEQKQKRKKKKEN